MTRLDEIDGWAKDALGVALQRRQLDHIAALPPLNPECSVGKHAACHGDTWDYDTDQPADCTGTCHQPAAAA